MRACNGTFGGLGLVQSGNLGLESVQGGRRHQQKGWFFFTPIEDASISWGQLQSHQGTVLLRLSCQIKTASMLLGAQKPSNGCNLTVIAKSNASRPFCSWRHAETRNLGMVD